MKSLLFKVMAFFFGLVISALVILSLEYFFILNNKYNWFQSHFSNYTYNPAMHTKLYDYSDLNLEYLKNLVPYQNYGDNSEADLYNPEMFKFLNCSKDGPGLYPFWLGKSDCDVQATLKKEKSQRVVYNTIYNFNTNALRVIPSAVAHDNFLLFLGCSFTMGEGVDGKEIFPNLVTKSLSPMNAFNLAMMGWAPNQILKLIETENDIRLQGIHGKNGLAIYTFIDDHFLRVLGGIARMKISGAESDPYYYLEKDKLVSGGSFLSGRYYRTLLYKVLANSQLISFFKIEYPTVDEDQMKLFAAILLQIKIDLKDKFHTQNLVVSFYPGQSRYANGLIPYLEKNSIEYFNFSEINLGKLMNGREILNGNFHPSPVAHRFYSDLLLKEINKRHLITR